MIQEQVKFIIIFAKSKSKDRSFLGAENFIPFWINIVVLWIFTILY